MLSRLQLGDFRNYHQADLTFSPGLNLVLGANASGKTSLLEAIYFIGSGGRSFRGGRLSRLVRDGADAATLFAEVTQDSIAHRLGVRRSPSGIEAIKLDGSTPSALSEVAALLPVLALHPGSVELVFGAATMRRRFLDWGMFHVEHSFSALWRQGSAALRQRNALLKNGTVDWRQLRYWDQQLAESSDKIERLRRTYLRALQGELDRVLAELSPALSIRLALQTGLRPEEGYGDALERLRAEDVRRGFTQAGFHRADVRMEVGGRVARERLSRGQGKIVAYAMVLAQLPLIASAGKVCTLLVDDLGAELDPEHRHLLLRYLATSRHQTVVTALEKAQAQPLFGDQKNEYGGVEPKVFHVEHGKVSHLTDRR